MKSLFEIQKDFTERFVRDKTGKEISDLTEQERLTFLKDYLLHLYQELSSILNNCSYKMHRNPMEELIHPNVFEEIVDTIKFSLGLWCILGKDAEDFDKSFRDKSEVVEWRYKQDQIIDSLSDREVAILDIDGVLAEYPGPMLEFMSKHAGERFETKAEAQTQLGIIKYEQIKSFYRKSGIKSRLPLVQGAKEFIKYLRDREIPIVLISSRPYEKYLNILADTLSWAQFHDLQFDALYFDADKGLKIAKRFPKARFFVDDSIAFIEDICSTCVPASNGIIKAFLFDPSEEREAPNGSIRVSSFQEIIDILEG